MFFPALLSDLLVISQGTSCHICQCVCLLLALTWLVPLLVMFLSCSPVAIAWGWGEAEAQMPFLVWQGKENCHGVGFARWPYAGQAFYQEL